jgi:hypothetical protein
LSQDLLKERIKMKRYRTILIGAAACLLLTCTSCQLPNLDANGDGTVTGEEIVSAIVDAVCGDSSDTTTTDGSDTGSSSDNSDTGTTDGSSAQ